MPCPLGYAHISTATTTVVRSGKGTLRSLIINTAAAGTITIYDNTSAAGQVIAVIAASAPIGSNFYYDIAVTTGITIVTGAATDITVCYE